MTTETNDQATDTSAPEESVTQKDEMVSKADLDRALKDLHKYKQTAREYEAKLKGVEEAKLKEQQNWQQLAEIKDKEAKEAREESERIKTSYVSEKKFSAVREAAMRAGILPTAVSDLELLALDSVVLETTSTGKLNVLGADQFVNGLKSLKPHWFGAPKTNVNSSIPDVSAPKSIGKQDLIKLSLEAQKTGDYTVYQKAMEQYKQQQR